MTQLGRGNIDDDTDPSRVPGAHREVRRSGRRGQHRSRCRRRRGVRSAGSERRRQDVGDPGAHHDHRAGRRNRARSPGPTCPTNVRSGNGSASYPSRRDTRAPRPGSRICASTANCSACPEPKRATGPPQLLDQLGLGHTQQRISHYSRGMRQRLGLCRAMINRPDVLFLDEPTLGLDPAGKEEVVRQLADIARRRRHHGRAVHAPARRGRAGMRPCGDHGRREAAHHGHRRRGDRLLRCAPHAPVSGCTRMTSQPPTMCSVSSTASTRSASTTPDPAISTFSWRPAPSPRHRPGCWRRSSMQASRSGRSRPTEPRSTTPFSL